MKLEQAARQALEALETSRGQWIHSVNAALCVKAIAILEEALDERPISQEQNCCCDQGQVCTACDPELALREALDPELQFVRDWNEGKVRRVSDGKVMDFAEQAEQEPVDHIGIKHDAQLVDTFLRCPMTGNQLYFASEPIQKKGMNYMRLQDSDGNDWTLIARLDEGWDGK